MWMWTAGSYAEPLMSDENSESWSSSIQIADIHTDRVAGNHLRDVNYAFKQGSFCPPAAVPGFFSHQTERSDYTGRAYYTDYDIRDFDFMGYKYSLLSSIGTAGLNTVINMVPGRDMEEFQAFVSARGCAKILVGKGLQDEPRMTSCLLFCFRFYPLLTMTAGL